MTGLTSHRVLGLLQPINHFPSNAGRLKFYIPFCNKHAGVKYDFFGATISQAERILSNILSNLFSSLKEDEGMLIKT